MAIATGTALAISALAGAGATAYGANKQESGNKRASEFEYKAQTEALDDARAERERQRQIDDEERTYSRGRAEEAKTYGRGQYADYLGRLSPYANAGSKAVSGLSATLPNPSAVRGQVGGGPMITIVNPATGKQYSVPATQRDHWMSKGAQIVGGA